MVMTTGSGDYSVGEKVWQGGSGLSTSSFNAEVINWTLASKTLEIAGATGTFVAALGLTGNDSGIHYVAGSTAATSETTIIPSDSYADNSDLQIEADDIFDFTDKDPFSEGNY